MINRVIEITSSETENVSGTSNRTGKPYSFKKQTAYLHVFGQDYPDKTELILDDAQVAYAPGHYHLDGESIYVDRNGRLALTPKLVPVVSDAKKAS